jgi:serine/threonine-protein kinase
MNETHDTLGFLAGKDRYIRLYDLGQGSVGKVYAVFDTFLQRVVARKELNPDKLGDEDISRAFVNEIQLMGHLSHPGILPIYDASLNDKGEPAYVMGLADGRSLSTLLQVNPKTGNGVPLSLEQAVRILLKLSEALTYAHDRGILHLDLKPENIMVGDYGEVLIMDWGAARIYDLDRYNGHLQRYSDRIDYIERRPERDNLLIGTPMFMSPEQFYGDRQVLTPASDIFSVGLIAYQMLAGDYPFKAKTLEELTDKICHEAPPPVHKVNTDVPHSLSRICEKMLAKNPADRYRSFADVGHAIGDYQRSAAGFPLVEFQPGEIIFNEGDAGDFVYVVVSGKVGITIAGPAGPKKIAELGDNEPFGELAALTGNDRTATAVALEKSLIRKIGKQEIAAEIEKLSPWVGSIVEALSRRFVEMNERVLALERQKTASRPGLLAWIRAAFFED